VHTLISWCVLKLDEVKGHVFIFESSASGVWKSFTCSSPVRACHDPKSLSALFSCSTTIRSPLYPFLPFSFSAVLPLAFRQSLQLLRFRWCSQIRLHPSTHTGVESIQLIYSGRALRALSDVARQCRCQHIFGGNLEHYCDQICGE